MDLASRIRERIAFFRDLDFRVRRVERGHVVMEVPHDPRFEREGGILFGGIIALLFDAVMGAAVYTVNTGKDQATISLTVDFLRPARADLYTLEGRVIKRGKRVVFVDGVLYGSEHLLARAHGIWFLKD